MNELEIFKNENYGEIRTLSIDGEVWFVAADVCRALGLEQTTRAMSRLDDDEKGLLKVTHPQNPQKVLEVNGVNEQGLYHLVLCSTKPEAKEFRRWITHDVIPSIRKHGIYMTKTALEQVTENPELIYMMADRLTKEYARAESLNTELETARPKAEYYDTFVSLEDCTNIRATAKELQVPERRFCDFLIEQKYLYRSPAGRLMPYAKAQNDGLFRVKDFCIRGHRGEYTLITPTGKDLFRKLTENLKNN